MEQVRRKQQLKQRSKQKSYIQHDRRKNSEASDQVVTGQVLI